MADVDDERPRLDRAALEQLLAGLTAVRGGDFSTRLAPTGDPLVDEIAAVFNRMVDQLDQFTSEVTRVAREVGTDGKLGGQANVPGVSGTWKDLTESVNAMAGNLTWQVRNIAQVATAVAKGDLTQKIDVDAQGEILELKTTLNTMVDQLSAFADEVTRVAREVGTQGNLGGQAVVHGVSGTWKDLTDNVNSMANNLTGQVRNIAQVTTAVAQGDLTKKIDVDASGEILELKTTINTMVDQLSAFAAEVTRVAREVGREGKLGGQAEVEGVSGTWKRLTENVNELSGTLTRQVRAISGVTSAVAAGDLTRTISVEAEGEVAELKDSINAMVRSLRETVQASQDQDWLKTNLASIGSMLQGHRDLEVVAELIMEELAPLLEAQHGTFFLTEDWAGERRLRLIAGYGLRADKDAPIQYRIGQSLIGQVAKSKRPIVVDEIPHGYIKISSGLGEAAPTNLAVMPVLFEDQVLGVVELASFTKFTADQDRLPRAARRDPGDQRQRDHRQLPHRRAARGVAAADRRAAGPLLGAAGPVRGAAAVQRRPGGQGGAAGRAEAGHRGQERGDRAGQGGDRGAGPAARARLAVQVAVPREHVARAAHPAEQPADPGPAARAEPAAEPVRQAGRVRERHPLRRL